MPVLCARSFLTPGSLSAACCYRLYLSIRIDVRTSETFVEIGHTILKSTSYFSRMLKVNKHSSLSPHISFTYALITQWIYSMVVGDARHVYHIFATLDLTRL